jgi:hypothetical protein
MTNTLVIMPLTNTDTLTSAHTIINGNETRKGSSFVLDYKAKGKDALLDPSPCALDLTT